MKKTKKITIILSIIIVFMMLFNFIPCEVWADNFDMNAFDNVPDAANGMKTLVNDTAITAIGIMRIVCVTIAIVILLVISMKYMMSAPGDRADIKKHAVHYVIGAFILFGVTGILGVISNFADHIK